MVCWLGMADLGNRGMGRDADVASRDKNYRKAILLNDRVALIRQVCWPGLVHLRDRGCEAEVVVGRDYGRANDRSRMMIYGHLRADIECRLWLSTDVGHLGAMIGLMVLWINSRSRDCGSKTTRISSSAEAINVIVEREKPAATIARCAGPRARPRGGSRRVHDENRSSGVEKKTALN